MAQDNPQNTARPLDEFTSYIEGGRLHGSSVPHVVWVSTDDVKVQNHNVLETWRLRVVETGVLVHFANRDVKVVLIIIEDASTGVVLSCESTFEDDNIEQCIRGELLFRTMMRTMSARGIDRNKALHIIIPSNYALIGEGARS